MPSQEKKNIDAITLLSLRQVSDAIGFSAWTIEAWIRAGKFPKFIVAMPGSPRRWRLRDVEAWIETRRRARNVKRMPRGRLKRGVAQGRFRPRVKL